MNKKIKQELEKINKQIYYLNTKKETLEWVLNLEKNNPINTSNIICLGEEITIHHKLYGDIPFIVIGKNCDAVNSVTLLTRDIVTLLAFDAEEPNNTDSCGGGNNRYVYSNILQWMNSDKAGGEWYTAQHEYDAPPDSDNVTNNPYSNRDGLLRGFDNDIINSMITIPRRSIGNYADIVPSKVFLLSANEVGLANDNNIAEGKIYEYFSNNNVDSQRLAYPSKYCLDNAGGVTKDTEFSFGRPWYWWLRTPSSSNSAAVRVVSTYGPGVDACACSGINGLRFAICLSTDKYLELKEKEN